MTRARVNRSAARIGAALAILGCAGWSARAGAGQEGRADPADRIGVLEVATYGVSVAAGDKFEQSVEETLTGVGFRVVRSKVVQQQLAGSNYVAGCTFGPCLKEVRTRTGLRRVLVARIQGAGQTYNVIVSLVDTESGQLVSQVAVPCPVCTVEDAISTSTLAVVELLTKKSGAGSGSGGGGEAALGGGAALGGAAHGGRELASLSERLERRRRDARRTGWIFVAGGAVGVALGGGLLAADQTNPGMTSLGLGGGLAAAGLTALLWSSSF